jgi:hypothetical protein
MFGQLAREAAKRPPHDPPSAPPQPHPPDLFLYHPIQLAGLLEAAWAERFRRRPVGVLYRRCRGTDAAGVAGVPE